MCDLPIFLGGLFFSRSFHGFVCSHVLLLGGSLLCLGLIAVIMIMVMTAAGAVNMPVLISLNRSFQFLTAYRAFSDFRLVEQEVDDLVLIKRRAKLGAGHWLMMDILDEALAILGNILLRGLHDRSEKGRGGKEGVH